MKLEISIHALGLKNVAGAFKGTSDPFAVVTKLATQPGDKPNVLGKTEVVKNNLSPHWVKLFEIDYELGEPSKIAVTVFDEIKKGSNKTMGSAVFDIAECLGARGNVKAKKLKTAGTVFCTVRKSQGSGTLTFNLKGTKLKNVEGGLFAKSDPFFELSRNINSAGGLTWDNVYRSKHIKSSLEPVWDTVEIALSVLCGGALDAPVQISVFDHESSGKHTPMGKVEVSVNGLVQAAQSGKALKLLQKGKDVGSLIVTRAQVTGVVPEKPAVPAVTQKLAETSVAATAPPPAPFVPQAAPHGHAAPYVPSQQQQSRHSFVDYISGGCQLNVVVAIDFTGSNGDPRKPGTLHHMDQYSNNDYEQAMSAILNILAKYDSDQQFPVLGFGAKYGGIIRHSFQVGSTPEVPGVRGVLEAYNQVFRSGLVMSGPTVITEVLEEAAKRAKIKNNARLAYTILVILTDGAVSDVPATAQCLERIAADDTPLSVVIVGIGNADFSSMQFLDDFSSQHDIAQFVEFNKYRHSAAALTSETLREIPAQLEACFARRGMAPGPALVRGDSVVAAAQEEDDQEIDLTLDTVDDEIVVRGGGNYFEDGFQATRMRM